MRGSEGRAFARSLKPKNHTQTSRGWVTDGRGAGEGQQHCLLLKPSSMQNKFHKTIQRQYIY